MGLVGLFALLSVALFVLLLLAQLLGRWIGRRRLARYGESGKPDAGSGAVQGAVFALLGLLVAFTFTGAASRYEHRVDLAVQHVNAMGTAWLRLDLLPSADAESIRSLFRRYVDIVYRAPMSAGDPAAQAGDRAELATVEHRIWDLTVAAAQQDGRPQVATLLLPALNEMFDLTASRLTSAFIHVHTAVIWLLVALAVLAGLVAGLAQAGAERRDLTHMAILSLVFSATLYFILDFELPRHGFIRLDAADRIVGEFRAGLD